MNGHEPVEGGMTALSGFRELRDLARRLGPVPVALVGSDTASGLAAMAAAAADGIVAPILVGDVDATRDALSAGSIAGLEGARLEPAAGADDAGRIAVRLARAGEAAVLLKGSLRTDQLVRAVLDRANGLRTGRLLSDVLLYEDRLAGRPRLVGVTDGGITPEPGVAELQQIVANAVTAFAELGFRRPRVALLSATETVSEAVPSTRAARAVAEWAATAIRDADVDGPLALDNALLPAAAAAKGIGGPVAGRADIMVAPSLEAGNILGKAAKYLAGSITAHVVVGARIPILIPSRVESAEDKLHSIALGVVVGAATGA
jgi:phosphate butyryltransferase